MGGIERRTRQWRLSFARQRSHLATPHRRFADTAARQDRLTISPANPQRMYALIQGRDQGSVWRSDDGGASWKVVSHDRNLIMRAGYYIRIEANPKDANGVLVLDSAPHYSSDGGLTFSGEGGKSAKPLGPASC